jgi:hypothetical protein
VVWGASFASRTTSLVSRGEDAIKYFWKHCYGIGDCIHWALCDEESDKENKVTDHLMVLFASEPKCLDGQPLTEQPIPKRIVDLLNRDQETCKWERMDHDSDCYETSCGQAFCLTDGTPKENKFKFCSYCGRKIESD